MSRPRQFATLDIYLAAFLALHRIPCGLEVQSNRVIFTFQITENFYSLCARFNQNDPVPVLDFITQLKELRSRMLARKEDRRGGDGKANSLPQ